MQPKVTSVQSTLNMKPRDISWKWFILPFVPAVALMLMGAVGVNPGSTSSGTSSSSTTTPKPAFYRWGGTNVQWRMVKNITLTNVVDVSACAYFPSNGTFFTIHNNANGRITEWTLDGVFIRKIDGVSTHVPDAETITWMGGNRFAVMEEDQNRIYILSITNNASGTTWATNNTQIIQLHSSIGVDPPSGVEGLAWDQDRNGWWVAKEKAPAQLLFVSANGQTTNNYFSTAQMQTFTNATHTDFSDVYLDRENQLLWVAQDETGQNDRVLAISLVTSNVVCSILVTNFGQLEGLSVTPDGMLLLAGEANQFAIYEPMLGGINSGISWPLNANTNLPNAPHMQFGFSVGPSGASITNVLSASGTLDFPVTTAQTETNLTLTVTGAADGDPVFLAVPSGSLPVGSCFTAFASNNVVHVKFNNYSSTTKDPASGTFRAVVFKIR